jgi:hypothetical protein
MVLRAQRLAIGNKKLDCGELRHADDLLATNYPKAILKQAKDIVNIISSPSIITNRRQ